MDIESIISILKDISVEEDSKKRQEYISTFQNLVWSGKIPHGNKALLDILNALAHDLDYYEANPEWRKEDFSFYDEQRLRKEIKCALDEIENVKKL